jgi:hypothetical protein
MTHVSVRSTPLIAVAVVAAACTSILGDDFTVSEGSGGGAGNPTSGGNDPTGGNGGTPSGGAGTGAQGGGGSGNGGSGGSGGGCTVDTAPPVTLNMIWTADRSGSMGTTGAWGNFMNEVANFVLTPGWQRINVAMNFFPASGGSQCNSGPYTPPVVGLTDIVADPSPITSALSATGPLGNATIPGALEATLDFALDVMTAGPDERTVHVMFADGQDTMCSMGGPSQLATQATVAFNQGLSTYGVVLRSEAQFMLNQIASSGGTGGPFIAIDAVGVSSVLAAIRDDALHCAHHNSTGISVAADLDVSLAGTATVPLTNVAGPAACNGDQWYFNNAAGDRILLCPDACTRVTNDPAGVQVELQYGCP